MWRRHRFKLLVTAAAISITVVLLFMGLQRPAEPTYKGLTMRQWAWLPETRAKEQALLILGTNNLPLLVQRLKCELQKDRCWALYRRLPARLQKLKWLSDLGRKKVYEEAVAVDVMRRLRHLAAPAVPELSEMARSANVEVAQRVIEVLAHIGEEGVPGIAAGMYNTNQDVRRGSFGWLSVYQNAPGASNAITNALLDPDPYIRQEAARITEQGRFKGN